MPPGFWHTGETHEPPSQVSPPGQTWPHPPQLFTSEVTFWQAPPQSAKPPSQLMPHVPALHVADPLAGVGQTWPQPPQLSGSLPRLASQPSLPSSLQSW